MSHDPSEIILICWFAAQETFCWKQSCCLIFFYDSLINRKFKRTAFNWKKWHYCYLNKKNVITHKNSRKHVLSRYILLCQDLKKIRLKNNNIWSPWAFICLKTLFLHFHLVLQWSCKSQYCCLTLSISDEWISAACFHIRFLTASVPYWNLTDMWIELKCCPIITLRNVYVFLVLRM